MYKPSDHSFRFAAWAAGRASARGVSGLSGETATSLLKAAGIDALAHDPRRLPPAAEFDRFHTELRQKIIDQAPQYGLAGITHGRAAKLINIALKALFLQDFGAETPAGPYSKAQLDAIHPPIDSVLLKELTRTGPQTYRSLWSRFGPWTKLDSDSYEALIECVRTATGGELWRIEQYWQGYQ